MKWLIPFLTLLVVQPAHADAASDAYSAGASLAGSSKGQGTAAAKHTDPSSVIPGYTSGASQSSYYGGVTGGDGGLSGAGQSGLSGSEAGQAAIDSGTNNPPVAIDPDAPFITIGKEAEANAGSVLDGTGSQCSEVSVSKTTFENYQCDRDVNAFSACSRTAAIALNEQMTVKDTEERGSGSMSFSYVVQNTGPVNAASLTITDIILPQRMCDNTSAESCAGFKTPTVSFLGKSWPLTVTTMPQKFKDGTASFSVTLSGLSLAVSQGQALPSVINYGFFTYQFMHGHGDDWTVSSPASGTLNSGNATVVLNVTANVLTKVPYQTWTTSCPNGAGSGQQVSTTCTEGEGTHSQTINGEVYSLSASCWAYQDNYVNTSYVSNGTCQSLMSDAACTQTGKSCSAYDGNYCSHESVTYNCQKTYTSSGQMCAGDYLCKSGSCDETNGAGDSGFDTAVAKLAGLASAGEDVKADQVNVKAFTGQALYCRKAMAGFSNCCVDSGWGNSAGLANCNSDEMAIGKAKAKKVTVLVGEACNRSVLGVCVQKKQAYCVFGGKLARIIQEQGRRDQLHVSFGSGDSPDCRGITVPELQAINFDLINFQDFYSDLMANQKIPDSATMVQQAKDRIAAQVKAQTGGK
ncbi:type-F conjugative transfer system mating-pair stabilization protein TraN [Pantoea sp. Acro-805]|uniref:Type-F conjugative transfer system mating-pair stabilization protein TraN n=1 Tax=Candidatus Pantoea formicae TaxID=2608355 RepID=A0ABX0R2Q0_9GAMM|nr:type-F conjugative transfer system mating-pair stabilization protein TraN [Pantoea formicae]NIF03508.1 type-F conjugative transfer system mating-pair stabilization protein TraN [Pantoea formicae]